MIDITSVIFGAAFTGIVAGLGYLIKRRISREGDREQASLMSSAADIAAKLKSNGLSYEEVEAISYLIVARKSKKKALDIKPAIINKPDSELEMADNDQGTIDDDVKLGYWTQSAMNARSFASYNRAQADLDYIIAELISVMDEEEKSIFEISQEKWNEFRLMQADFVAYQVKGGSMEPLLRNSENESLIRQRIVSLQAIFEERKK